MKKLYCTKLDRPHEESEHCADGCVAVYLASEVETFMASCAMTAADANRLGLRVVELEKALHGILGYFRSGNSIPVERATIKADAPEIIFAKSVL